MSKDLSDIDLVSTIRITIRTLILLHPVLIRSTGSWICLLRVGKSMETSIRVSDLRLTLSEYENNLLPSQCGHTIDSTSTTLGLIGRAFQFVFRVVTPCSLVGGYSRISSTFCLHLQYQSVLIALYVSFSSVFSRRRFSRASPAPSHSFPPIPNLVNSSWNLMAHGNALKKKWRGNWRMQWVASTLHTTSEHGVSSITTADAHTSAASSRLNWRPRRFKWTRPFLQKTKSGFCACAITFQLASTYRPVTRDVQRTRSCTT